MKFPVPQRWEETSLLPGFWWYLGKLLVTVALGSHREIDYSSSPGHSFGGLPNTVTADSAVLICFFVPPALGCNFVYLDFTVLHLSLPT